MKKFWGILFILVFSLISIKALEVNAATTISLNETNEGILDKGSNNNYHDFTIAESGRLTLNIESKIQGDFRYKILNGEKVITSDSMYGKEENPAKETITLDLEPGNYTFHFYAPSIKSMGVYTFSTEFEPSNSVDQEPNNGVAQAEAIFTGTKKIGYLSWNDSNDYHKITLTKSTILTMYLEGYLNKYTYYQVLDTNNTIIDSDDFRSSAENPAKITKTYFLEPGDYYIRVYSKYEKYSGKYILEVNSKTINTDEIEPNNGTTQAQPLAFGQTNKGFIAWNDTDDYYSFNVNKAKEYTIAINSSLNSYTYVQLIDDQNNIVWSDYSRSSEASPAKIEKKINLNSGKYYIRVYAKFNRYLGEYDVTILGDGISAFKDYQLGAYWTNSFAWGMNNNIIKGDLKSRRLNPNTPITEAQWLAMLLRYSHNQKDAATGKWYDTYYKKAKELGIQTNGKPNEPLNRVTVAKMLVTVYEGKNVSEKEAVELLYKKGITTGVNPNLGQTFENFNPNGKLTRAQAITFMYRLYGN